MQHIVFVAIKPINRDEIVDLEQALLKIVAGDPAYDIETHQDSGEVILRAPTEIQLETLTDLLNRECDIDVEVSPPQVVLKETITQSAEGEGRFTVRWGGGGRYAHAKIRLAPADPGSGYRFENRLGAGILPDALIRSVDESIREQLTCGMLGHRVDDVRVELFDGSFHETDSSDTAFRIAGSMAFQDAEKKAGPVLLEPVMTAEVVAPDVFMGDLIADLNSRRAVIAGIESKSGNESIRAIVPLATMLGYATHLRAKTHGRASYFIQFDHYAPIPDSPDPEDEDRIAPVLAPLKPKPGPRNRGVALPEPDED